MYLLKDVASPDNESDGEYVTSHKPVIEQGVLVQCPVSTAAAAADKHNKQIPKFFYWIVGLVKVIERARVSLFLYICRRKLSESGKEFYVCFQDTVPQNTVELAFRLHFGSVD